MDPERADYADPESPDRAARDFDLSVIGGAVVWMCLAFLPMFALAAVYHIGPRGRP